MQPADKGLNWPLLAAFSLLAALLLFRSLLPSWLREYLGTLFL